jgi:hypothetical protein
MLQSITSVLLGPAITGAVIAFVLNTRDERLRASRDFHTKFLESARDDVRDAVFAGVAYFTSSDPKAIKESEAKVLLYESEIRSNMAAIRAACDKEDIEFLPELETLEAPFLEALTGGTFGSSSRIPAPAEAQKLVGRGSLLRSDLAKLRRHQLDRAKLRMQVPQAMAILFGLIFTTMIGFGLGLYASVVWSPN